jgi:hypothetical protein
MEESATCEKHPDRKAAASCRRYNHGFCADCLDNEPVCPDPEMFCRYRERCLVYFSYKEKQREERHKAAAGQ